MVEQPKYLEMTLSQLKSYVEPYSLKIPHIISIVESSESKVLLVVEFPKGDQNNGE